MKNFSLLFIIWIFFASWGSEQHCNSSVQFSESRRLWSV